MTDVVALLLVVTLSAYVLFGGADLGGGILEATLPSKRLRDRLQATLGPIWEANHVWLVAVVVILFVGFPKFYAEGFTRLFVPISLALLGVLLRGVFFTLRKYDPDPSPAWIRIYSALFRFSSALAPFFFGLIVGGLLTEQPILPSHVSVGANYREIYVAPWLHPFGILCGLFVSTLFGYVAAVFFYGELSDADDREAVWRRVVAFFVATFVSGGAVLVLGAATDRVPVEQATNPIQIVSQVVAALGIFALWRSRRSGSIWGMRAAAGAQVLAILVGWFHAQAPVLLKMAGGPLTLEDAAAPFRTQLWLAVGFVAVLAMVVPLLVWLYRVFGAPRATARG